ncbi:hypothetical protein [Cellulomonas iranensis]|uniref:hypothetical protein n=2 Tax=Cellulomonas iranensis TaxID=76862 RepID=UPI000B3C840C|nr:hypothetical protein [Cellulomonas iranensis]
MTTRRTVLATTTLVLAAALTGCATFQDVFPVGQREFTYATSADVERSGESFRFQGFLPQDATDVRLLAQLDGHAGVMHWTSPTPFDAQHCTATSVTGAPDLEPAWLLDPLPADGYACGTWTVVSVGDTHQAWRDEPGSGTEPR